MKRPFWSAILAVVVPALLAPSAVVSAQDAPQAEPTPPPMQVSDPIPSPPPAPPTPTPAPVSTPSALPALPPQPPAQSLAPSQPVPSSPAPATVSPPSLQPAPMTYATPSGAAAGSPTVAIGRPLVKMNFGAAGNRAAAQLRSMPPETFTFDRAMLRDVLRVLAEQAGIPYIGIPEHSTKAQRLVTFKMTASPFAAIEAVCRQNDILLTYDDGVWFMRINDPNLDRISSAVTENELISVVYQLRYDPVDRVRFKDKGQGGQASQNAGNISVPELGLQTPQTVFSPQFPRIVNEIRNMLGLPSVGYEDDSTGGGGDGASSAPIPGGVIEGGSGAQQSDRSMTTMPVVPPFDGEMAPLKEGDPAKQTELFPVYVPPQRPQVIFNSDSNILWVVATRKQHEWIREFLSRVDKPQDLIAIEVKFFETKKNPKTDFGINWQGTFGDGITVRGSANAGTDGRLDYNVGQPASSFTGSTQTTTYSAVLGVDEVSATIQAFMQDRNSSLVQYPRVLTLNNREVAITTAESIPLNAGVSQTQENSTATQTGTIAYLPVGTQINILPKVMAGDEISMTVAITVSSVIGEVEVDLGTGANPYPITSQRVYNANLQVKSGYTLAVGGLEKVDDSQNQGGIPLLKDIPIAGYLFKNKGRERNRVNLIIFITPYSISDPSRTPGISESPEAVIPLRPGVPPPAPVFSPDGQLIGGSSALPNAFRWLEFQLRYFRELNAEARVDRKSLDELRGVIARARSLSGDLQMQVAAGAGSAPADVMDNAARADSLLLEFNRLLADTQKNIM